MEHSDYGIQSGFSGKAQVISIASFRFMGLESNSVLTKEW